MKITILGLLYGYFGDFAKADSYCWRIQTNKTKGQVILPPRAGIQRNLVPGSSPGRFFGGVFSGRTEFASSIADTMRNSEELTDSVKPAILRISISLFAADTVIEKENSIDYHPPFSESLIELRVE